MLTKKDKQELTDMMGKRLEERLEERLQEHYVSMVNIFVTKDEFKVLSNQISDLRDITLQLVNKDQNEYTVMQMHVEELQETSKKHDTRITSLEKNSPYSAG